MGLSSQSKLEVIVKNSRVHDISLISNTKLLNKCVKIRKPMFLAISMYFKASGVCST
jgi:hypothetical protein